MLRSKDPFMSKLPFSYSLTSITILFLFFFAGAFTQSVTAQFVKGADIGWLEQMEATGYKFYDSTGVQKDCLQILKDKEISTFRTSTGSHEVRIFDLGDRLVEEQKLNNSTRSSIHLDLLPGVYLVNVDTGESSFVEKLVVL